MTYQWRDKARCKGMDPNLWFPLVYSAEHDTRMTKICFEECPVQEQCLENALENVETKGIWGGFTQAELKGIRTKRYSRCRKCGLRWPKARLTKETTCRLCKIKELDDG